MVLELLDLFGLGVDQFAAGVQDVRFGAVGGDVHWMVSLIVWVRVDPRPVSGIEPDGNRSGKEDRQLFLCDQGIHEARAHGFGFVVLGAELAVSLLDVLPFVVAAVFADDVGHLMVCCVVPG